MTFILLSLQTIKDKILSNLLLRKLNNIAHLIYVYPISIILYFMYICLLYIHTKGLIDIDKKQDIIRIINFIV
jgi:hypothetical protein